MLIKDIQHTWLSETNYNGYVKTIIDKFNELTLSEYGCKLTINRATDKSISNVEVIFNNELKVEFVTDEYTFEYAIFYYNNEENLWSSEDISFEEIMDQFAHVSWKYKELINVLSK